jgi:hypothetical protein
MWMWEHLSNKPESYWVKKARPSFGQLALLQRGTFLSELVGGYLAMVRRKVREVALPEQRCGD